MLYYRVICIISFRIDNLLFPVPSESNFNVRYTSFYYRSPTLSHTLHLWRSQLQLFVAWVRDLLNLWNYFTCILAIYPPFWPKTAQVFLPPSGAFGQFLRLSLCYSNALSLQDLHKSWEKGCQDSFFFCCCKSFTQVHMLD